MTAWIITALILIIIVLLGVCGLMAWGLHELAEDRDLATQHLVRVLESRGDPQKLINGLNGYAHRLPPGQPG